MMFNPGSGFFCMTNRLKFMRILTSYFNMWIRQCDVLYDTQGITLKSRLSRLTGKPTSNINT